MKTNEATYPAWYLVGMDTILNRAEFDRARQVQKDYSLVFDVQTRQLIASDAELAAEKIKSSEAIGTQINNTINRQMEILQSNSTETNQLLENLSSDLQEINSTLELGFSQLTWSMDRMQDSLNQLVELIANPSATWALEQYTLAMDEARRKLYEQSLETVRRAISGYGSNVGLKSEFRFHMLLGALYLGEFANQDLKMRDLTAAEEAFLFASKCAGTDHKPEANGALILAARASYLQRKPLRALEHLSECTPEFRNQSKDWLFNVAKISASMFGDKNFTIQQEALIESYLFELFKIDVKYAMLASSDADLMRVRPIVERAIKRATTLTISAITVVKAKLKRTVSILRKFEKIDFSFGQLNQTRQVNLSPLIKRFDDLENTSDPVTLQGAFSMGKLYRNLFSEVTQFVGIEKKLVEQALVFEADERKSARGSTTTWDVGNAWETGCRIIIVIVCAIFFILSFVGVKTQFSDLPYWLGWVFQLFQAAIISAVVCAVGCFGLWIALSFFHPLTSKSYFDNSTKVDGIFTKLKVYQAKLEDCEQA
jgi:tetratricopeptide (TPR) repeat protein